PTPRPRPAGVLLEAIAVGVAGGVEPVPSPALTVRGPVEQPIDQTLISVRTVVREEVVDLLNRGRQTEQVEAQAADQCGSIRLRRWCDLLRLQPGHDKRIDPIADRRGIGDPGQIGPANRLKGPVIGRGARRGARRFLRPASALLDPGTKDADLCWSQWRV